jgi:hypothetical protein
MNFNRKHQFINVGSYNAMDKIRALCKEHGASVALDEVHSILTITHPEYKMRLVYFDYLATREACICGCNECIDGWLSMRDEIKREIKRHSEAVTNLKRAKFIWTTQKGDLNE